MERLGSQALGEDLLKELCLLIRSRYGLIWIKSADYGRMHSLLKHAASRLDLALLVWTPSGGLCRDESDNQIYGTSDPKTALDNIRCSRSPAIFYFQGLTPFLEDRGFMARLGDVACEFSNDEGAIVIAGCDVRIPEPARPHSAVLTPPCPEREEFEHLIRSVYRDLKARMPAKLDLNSRSMNMLISNLHGLTLIEAEKILTKAIVEDGRLDAADIEHVLKEKRAIIEREGLLEFIPVEYGFADIADLKSLKSWLAKRRSIILDPKGAAKFGLPFPKGILLLGVPGSGKSLCAKAVAQEWGLPLLRMDPSRLYNKYIGESEKNYRRAMETAERLAPVILWIDEIEKAFPPTGGEDTGVSQRVLGSFLSWLQDRRGDVFVAATANDIDRLPAELLRKGRFDEVFFVDLPDEKTRAEIFRIHIQRRGHNPGEFDLAALAGATTGFTGAEIEQTVVSALYTAFSGEACMNTDLLLKEIAATRPLSQIRAEYIQSLRDWAHQRTVSAQ
jgi:AAA+ superfamily predicted ATPase